MNREAQRQCYQRDKQYRQRHDYAGTPLGDESDVEERRISLRSNLRREECGGIFPAASA
ncbi:hypothetical protein [Kosakonia oryziphila]|uniref:hypothetical protein n=1 Tax=Kosakonia oryziphila TaxID=1005667 RepID=UPI001428BF23|nr:hypothetical protein [Kosakonia oryziphila]